VEDVVQVPRRVHARLNALRARHGGGLY
jgi:hypothetical protein